jgi:hypothetical protein
MKKILSAFAVLMIAGGAAAETKPFNASITPDVAVYDRSETIQGVTLSIWGENRQTALALGLVNGSIGQSAGVSAGLLNYTDHYKGLQWGVVNYASGDFSGWQGGPFAGLLVSAMNYTGGTMTGLQIGLMNYAGNLSGLQVGLVNYASGAHAGLQLGLINIIPQNKWFTNLPNELGPAMIFVNWRF